MIDSRAAKFGVVGEKSVGLGDRPKGVELSFVAVWMVCYTLGG